MYLWPPIPWHRKAMDKEIIKAMATKFSKNFAIIMLKKHRKFCRRGLTHLAATPTFQKSFRSFWVTLYMPDKWTYSSFTIGRNSPLMTIWAQFLPLELQMFF